MKHFYVKVLQILLWVLGSVVVSNKAMAQYTSSVLETGKFYTAIAKDNLNNIYVVAYNSTTTQYQVLKYTNGTGTPTPIYQGLSFSSTEYPWSIAVNSAGDVFIMDPSVANNWQIVKLAAGTYTSSVIQTGRFFTALTIDNSDNLLTLEYDAATTNYRVVKYLSTNLTGAGTTIYNGLPLAVGSGTYPWGIVADQSNNIYIIDFPNNSFNGRLIKLTAPGYAPTTLGSGKGYTSLAIDAQGNLYTTETVSSTTAHTMKYTAPVTTGATGTEIFNGLTIGSLFYPWGIAVTSQGNVFINDGAAAGSGRLIKLTTAAITVNSVTKVGSSSTNANSVQYTVTFSAAATNVTTSAFSLTTTGLTGASIMSVTGSGTTYTVTVNTGTGDGTLRLNVTGTGIANNVTNIPYTSGDVYTIDKTAPTGTLTINSGATFTNNTAVTLNITTSGATQMRFSTDNLSFSAYEAVAGSKAFTLPAGDGLKTVYMQLTDAAGNTQTYQAQITLDQTPPHGSFVSTPPLLTNSTSATFTFTANETATFKTSLDAGALITVTSPLTFTSLSATSHTLQLVATDQAGNTDLTPPSYNWTIDNIPPAVTAVSVPTDGYYHAGQALNFGVTFSEPVNVNTTGGTPSLDITIGTTVVHAPYVSGTGTATLLFSYTVQSGDMDMNGIALGANIATNSGTIQDAASNNTLLPLQNVGSTTNVFVNTSIPGVTVSTGTASPLNQPFTANIVFTEVVNGFVVGDITATNATLSAFQTADNITYTVLVTPTADGTVTVQVPASVAVNVGNNNNTASNILSRVYDATPPAITTLDVPANGIYHLGDGLRFKAHFTESIVVTGTPTLDITIGSTARQATYVGGSGSDTLGFVYVVQSGDVDMDGIALAAAITGTIKDAAGNSATLTLPAVNTSGVLVNTNIPGVSVSTTATSPVNQPFTATITFTEAMTGFTVGDITATNATLSAFQTADNITYTVLVTPTADGTVTVQVPASVAVNVGNNNNTASNVLSLAYDATPPTITTLDVPANGIYHLGDGLRFKAHFTESIVVTGTPTLDITIGSTTRQATYVGGSGSDTLGFVYVVQSGDVDMDGIVLAAAITGTVKDAAGNSATLTLPAVNTSGVLVNTTVPGVSVSTTATSPVNQPFTATITFTEAMTGFTVGDITATNATLSAFQTADNITYTVLVTPTTDGNVTVQVPASVAVNVGNNNNTASNVLSLAYDATPPTITTLDVPANGIYHLGDGLRFKAHFTESIVVTGTPTLDITIGSTTRQATYVGGSGSDTLGFVYVVQSGDVDMDGIALAAAITGTVKDAAGNSATLTLPVVNTSGVLVNTTVPGVSVSTTATSPVNQPFTATITFTEAMTGFTVGDITATNATLSAFQTADNITYTVLVTPTADGTVTLQVPASVAVNVGNNNNTASNVLSLAYDATPPTITTLDVPANGIYHLGDGLRFKAHFSESIAVTGTPTLDITIGSTTRQATYVGGSGSDTLGFVYVVQSGDVDIDGIALAAAITGTVKDAAGNSATLTLPAVNTSGVLVNTNIPGVSVSTTATSPVNQPFTATITFTEAMTGFTVGDITATNATLSAFQTADNITYTVLVTPTADGTVTVQVPASVAVNVGNNNNTASNVLSLVYDATPPTITTLDIPANGIYHLGDGLRFKAHFSESIAVTGTPTLDITIGSTTRQTTYVGGSGSDTLGFVYVVQSGDVDIDGIALAAAITGTVKDAAGNSATLTLPAVNTSGVLVNTTVPGVSVSTTATSPVNQPFTATITFTEAMTGFAVGDITATNATLSAFQTADNITYTILVTPTADGTVTVQVPASVAVNVGNNNNTASNVLSLAYDATPPTITTLDIPANGIYHLGDGLRFKAHFSESITVTGTPTLDITIGSTTRQATYVGGSGSDTLGFVYVVQSGDVDMDGIALAAAITGTVKDAAGNSATLTLPAVNTSGVLVNTTVPGVSVSTTATSPVNQPFTATITFTEAMTGFTVGDITATNATLSAFQTADNITYTVLVTPTADGNVTVQVPASVAVNVGNNNNTASNVLSLAYDATPPTITTLDVPANGIYHLGDGLRFKAHFSESIAVTGTPTLDITIGSTTRQATYVGGSGSDTLGFVYVVQSGDVDMDGIALAAAITGTIKDAAGNSATLTLPAVNTSGVLVNTNIPGVSVNTTATSPVNQPFTATITFTEAMTGFTVGDITATNATLSAFQTADNITYTVLVTPTADGTVTVQVAASVAVNVGNNNNTASNVLSLAYDATPPTVTTLDVPANGIYHLGDGLRFKAHFSESITVTGTPTLDITIGSTTRQATYVGGSGSDTLGFVYVVQSGDVDMDGIALAAAITGTIKDAAGNSATLTLPAVNTSGVLVNTTVPGVSVSTTATSPVNQPFTATITFTEAMTGFTVGDITATNATLSAFQTADNITYTVLVTPTTDGIVTVQVPASVAVNVGNNSNTASNILSLTFDGTAPVVTSVDVPANAVYHLGQALSFTVHFSEIVNVTGTPSLGVVIGAANRQATLISGSGTNALVFSYTVQNGDMDMDGITLGALTGAIHDAADNSAVLVLNNVASTTGVLVNTANPGVVISTTATSPVIQPFTATITFSEAVTGFVAGDITATNATLSAFQTTDNITYTVLVTPAADGAVTLQVQAGVAVNVGNNNNTASNTLSLVYAGTAPVITAVDVPANGTYTLGQVLSFTVHFSEPVNVTGASSFDVIIGATTRQAAYISGSGTSALIYRYTVQQGDMDMDGITLGTSLTGTIRNSAGKDALLTLNNAGNTTGVLVNTTNPGVVISTTATSPVIQPFTATITFSEAVTGFVAGDITATNATLSAFQTTDNITYTVLVTPAADGAVTLQVPAGVAVNAGNNNNTASNTLSLVYAGTAPVITAVDVPANGTYTLGQVLSFTVHFSEPVNVTGASSFDVIIGATTRQAAYVSGSGTNALLYRYTVQQGDMDMDGITLGTSLTGTIRNSAGKDALLTLNNAGNTTGVLVNTTNPGVVISTTATSPVIQPFTATITFSEAVTGFVAGDITATNATLSAFQTTDNITYTVLVTPAADGAVTLQVPAGVAVNAGNNNNTASNTLSLVYAGTAPVITAVDVPANGTYTLGQVLSFTVHFSEPVNVTGASSLDVIIGATTRQAAYVSGSGTNALLYRYTVQQGDMDMDGITLGTSLTGTIRNSAGKDALLTLNNAGNTTGVLVNTTNPGVVISTTATSPVIQPFTATITFSEAVTGFIVSDITATNATLSAFQTTDNITYTVLVTPAADGAVTLQVPAGVAVNVGNNNNTASNTLSLVYAGTAPVITAVDVPANGTYTLGQVLSFTVHFSEPVNVTGASSFDVIIGATTRQAAYISGSGTSALIYRYTVQQGDMDMDGITLGTSLTGTIRNSAGKDALLTLNNAGNTTGVLVNTTNPGVVISTTATSPVIQPFTATITFSEAVTGFVAGDITATNATLSAFQTTDNITYTVLVTPAADGAVTLQVPAGVAVNVGNNNNTASNTLSLVYAGTAPVITAVDVPANGTYRLGQVLSFTVHYSEPVNVTGASSFDVIIGATNRQAAYVSGSGTSALVYRYTVQQGDMDMDGITLGTSLTGTIRNSAGKDALLTLNNAGNTTGVLVNTRNPSVVLSGNIPSRVNTPVTINITFSELVNGFTTTGIIASNATVSNLQTADHINFTAVLTPLTDGVINVNIPAGAATNSGGNENIASNTLSFIYDATPPVISRQNFDINFNSPAGTTVGALTATDAAGTIQDWTITADGSGGAFAIDAAGTITVKDAAILSSKAGTSVSVTVTVSDELNTSVPTTIVINISPAVVNQAPTLDVIADAANCAGTEDHSIQLTGMSAGEPGQTYSLTVTADQALFDLLTVNNSGVLQYRFKNGITSGTANVTVTIKDNGGTANGGVDTRQRTFSITINTAPTVTISSNKGNTVSKGDIIQLTATGGNGYRWTTVDGIISGQQTAVLQARVMINTTYEVTAVNTAGCSNTATINITVVEDFKVEATNILTPNGDGKNDKWVIRNLDSYPDNEVKIYDRTGRVVYQRRNYSNDWDGTVSGNPLSEGTYYYILTINGNKKTAKGYITIIRDQQ